MSPRYWKDGKGNRGFILLESELSEQEKSKMIVADKDEDCLTKGSINFNKKVLAKLTENQREIISLFFFKYSKPNPKKIAERLGIARSTVYYRRNVALKKLRELIKI